MRKILYNNINKDIAGIIITGLDIYYNEDDKNILKKIIKVLAKEKNYYFYFRSEDDYFLEEQEINKYRKYIPEYFRKNGKYKILYEKSVSRFDAIGMLISNNFILDFILDLWKYYNNMSFFSSDTIEWDNYMEMITNNLRDINGVKLLQTEKSNHIFIKGHDGDYLIFNYVSNKYVLPVLDFI